MNVKSVVENKEKYEVELTVEVGKEEFEAGLDRAYRKSRGSISVPGFRKGKAPRKVIEGMYGSGVFYEDAVRISTPAPWKRPSRRTTWIPWLPPRWRSPTWARTASPSRLSSPSVPRSR
ncbi:MAG: trigger factor family protein [Firmicutes bacterium]|nr:trigger factor family protein [Bacillota bacterium]